MPETTVTAATPNLNKALSLLQGEMPKVTKTKTAEVKDQQTNRLLYKYDYADLGDVVADMGPLMAKHGLAFHCAPTINPADRREMILIWSLLHESGEERSGEWPLGPVNQKPQSLGSAITYGRRYSFTAATNIVLEDDDDGQRAQQDHGSRQSAAAAFDSATPARPTNQGPRTAEAEAIDHDAQVFADEAHKATVPADIEGIHKRAREAGKVASFIRNPASGGVGKLAVYLDWKRKQLMAAAPAEPASPDSDDPWMLKVEELASEDDAFAAVSELADQLNDGTIDGARFRQVAALIEAKFPQVNGEGRAA